MLCSQSSVAIEIPVSSPRGELLVLDVHLEGDDLSGADCVSLPPRETVTYKATFSPGRVGKTTGWSVYLIIIKHTIIKQTHSKVTLLPKIKDRINQELKQYKRPQSAV